MRSMTMLITFSVFISFQAIPDCALPGTDHPGGLEVEDYVNITIQILDPGQGDSSVPEIQVEQVKKSIESQFTTHGLNPAVDVSPRPPELTLDNPRGLLVIRYGPVSYSNRVFQIDASYLKPVIYSLSPSKAYEYYVDAGVWQDHIVTISENFHIYLAILLDRFIQAYIEVNSCS